jgi:hypothetical protein
MSYRGKYYALAISGMIFVVGAQAQQGSQTAPGSAQQAVQAQDNQPGSPGPLLDPQIELEPRALEALKTASDRLTAARTLSFTAVATYESPARTGAPLAYMTRFDVVLQRPDKLRVSAPADGPPSEFYYDGKVMAAYSPDTQLLAVADAPPTIEAMLKAAYERAAIYFPFTDLIVPDPYKVITDGLKLAFVVGQSKVVGDTTTDVIVVANEAVQMELWIGADDKLPRMARATFFDEPGNYRHSVAFSDWRLDLPVQPESFTPNALQTAARMPFARPDATLGTANTQGAKP